MKPLIRQIKGPGMNQGRAKMRRKPVQPKPVFAPETDKAPPQPATYIPAYAGGGRVQAMQNGKGSKQISCHNY